MLALQTARHRRRRDAPPCDGGASRRQSRPRATERPDPAFVRNPYREHNRVERLINRLKQFRRIAIRYEKRAANYLAMITIAAILLWL
ncbi:transposase [Azospirillum sp. YIM DDC1]|uniref:Transposase n=1 Tax=Azospirillum aestuarii TaxID=2802052 RepID=A0ABS1HRV0_9PROT|nr:transposase [Azospirillum aestuarii]